jgi:hypothetical protein
MIEQAALVVRSESCREAAACTGVPSADQTRPVPSLLALRLYEIWLIGIREAAYGSSNAASALARANARALLQINASCSGHV